MKLYLDFEWNDFRGDLLSIGIAAASGENFYAEFLSYTAPSNWVRENVLPHLIGKPLPITRVQDELHAWLWKCATEGAHIVADWPEDISRFCDLLIYGPGERMLTPPLSFEIVDSKAVSKVPHFALSDAVALREFCESQEAAS